MENNSPEHHTEDAAIVGAQRAAPTSDRPEVWKHERGTLWFMALPGDATRAAVPEVIPRIAADIREIQVDSAEALALAMDAPDTAAVRIRFASGRRCFVAWAEDTIAAYGWVSTGRECVGEMEREIRMQPGEAYIWDCVTRPAFRRQRLYSALLTTMATTLASESFRRIWIGTGLANTPSLRGFENAGFRPAILLDYLRVFNLTLTWCRAGDDAPGDVVAAAQRAFTGDHERRIGPLTIGWRRRTVPVACLQLQGANAP